MRRVIVGPGAEDLAHLGAHHQVEITLAVAGLHVGEAVVFFRQGPQSFGEDHKAAHRQGEFVGLGAEKGALKARQCRRCHSFLNQPKASSPSTSRCT